MFVTCNSHNCYKLIKGCIYKAIKETDKEYYIKLSKDVTGIYNKKDFTPTREEVMKIKEWKELDGVVIKGQRLKVGSDYIAVYIGNDWQMAISLNFSKEEKLAHLKLRGIEVEFKKEMTITQISKNILSSLDINPNCYVTKMQTCTNIKVGAVEIPLTGHLFQTLDTGKEYLVNDLLNMKVEG
jgi:hypothetical protein